jgi:PRC-barrel domain
MAVATDKTTEPSCWTTDFWLRHCEGFRVFAESEPIGFVEDVLESEDGEPTALVVRVGEVFTHLLEVPVEAIDAFDPARERVLIGPLAAERMKAYQLPIPTEV